MPLFSKEFIAFTEEFKHDKQSLRSRISLNKMKNFMKIDTFEKKTRKQFMKLFTSQDSLELISQTFIFIKDGLLKEWSLMKPKI